MTGLNAYLAQKRTVLDGRRVLATRVIVLSDRPARIRAEIVNAAPYPRHRDDPDLVRLRREVLEILGHAA